jgi:hypothetical protein
METIYRGENKQVQVALFQVNGTDPLLVADLHSLNVKIMQFGKIIESYEYPEPGILTDTGTSEVTLEILEEISLQFTEGTVTLKVTTETADASFETGFQKSVNFIDVYTAV